MSSMTTSRGRNQKGKTGCTKSTSGSTKRGRGRDDEGWGGFSNYMSAKKYKLGEQFDEENKEQQSCIFHGVAIYINGYTNPSSDELRRIITAHGGKYEMYLSKKKVTHIIATNLPNSKFHLAKSNPVVKPEWITESVAAGKCLPFSSYLTFDNKSKMQPGLKSFPSVSLLSRNGSALPLIKNDSNSSGNATGTLNSNNSTENGKSSENDAICPERGDIDSAIFRETSSLKSNDDQDLKEENQECHEDKISNDVKKEENKSDSESDPDIIYNSEDEDTPQRLKHNFTKLSGRPRSMNSPSRLIIGNNATSTPKARSCTDSQLLAETKNTNIMSAPISPIQEVEEESTGETEVISAPTTVTSTKASPSKPVSSSKPSVAKAGDKGFLNEFYSNSRLHHIATWGAEFKAYVADIQQKGGSIFSGRDQLRQTVIENATRLGMAETLESSRHGGVERTVMHIDMDCFFVSVGLLSRPDLKGKPVAVTHSKGQGTKPDPKSDAELEKRLWNLKKDKGLKSGPESSSDKPVRNQYDFAVPDGSTGFQTFHSMAEIASCSYEARKKGVKNGMFMGKAKALCPDLLTIPYDFDEYNRVSRILYDIVASFTHDIEAVSCDEMFVDCTDVLSDTGATAPELARLIRKEVFNKTGCTASVGIGPNILLARMATKKAKPNGVFQVFKQEAKAFIKEQNVSDLPGVGYSMSNKLARLGVTTCGDLQTVSESMLRREFGPKTGESLHRFSLGIDDRVVKGNKQRKSVSAEVNYGIRFNQESDAFKFLRELSCEVTRRLNGLGVKGRSITLKLMVKRPDAPTESAKFMGHGICNTVTKSTLLPMATNDEVLIGHEVVSMYKHHRISAPDVRGIGIQVHRLESVGGKGDQQSHSGSGHQSILQFAVHRKPATHTDIGSLAPQSRGLETTGRTLDEGGMSNRIGDSKAVTSFSSKNEVQRKSNAEPDYFNMRDVSFLLSPSQVSESVLDELPDDIAQEIRKGIDHHRKGRNRPSHASTSSSVVDDTAFRPSTSSNQCDNDVNIVDDLPSASQLDMSCFHALPSSLQKELEEAYAKQKMLNKVEEKSASPIKEAVDEPLADMVQEIRNGTEQGMENHNTALCPSTSLQQCDVDNIVDHLPSESQLDMSCFHALPRSLQKELEEAYVKQKQKNKVEEKRSPIKGTALEKLRSPAKDKGKRLKNRRGRPPGSRKKLQNSTKLKTLQTTSHQQGKSSSLRNVPGVKESIMSVVDGVICLDDDGRGGSDSRDTMDGCSNQDTVESAHFVSQPKVEFCGASSLKDVRNLFKEWIESCAEPGDSDVAMVTDYMTSLVHYKCLEQAFCLLRFLRRYVQMSSRSAIWKQCTEMIAALLQSVVLEVYGAEFKLS